MIISSLANKLQLKPGYRALILHAPENFIKSLSPLPDEVALDIEPAGEYEFVLLFVRDQEELNAIGTQALEVLHYDGVFWVAYPKKSSGVQTDISRDEGWDFLAGSGLRPVSAVAIDSTWSALRFRPNEMVSA